MRSSRHHGLLSNRAIGKSLTYGFCVNSDRRYFDGRYSQDNPTWHSEDATWKAGHISSILMENSVGFDSCVEVGCGAGRILEVLSVEFPGKRFVGWDVSPAAAELWDEIGGVEFNLGDASDASDAYDVALSIDVFEHVEDYIGFLRSYRRLAKWHVFHIPLEMNVSAVLRDRQLHSRRVVGHLHYFSCATAIATLEDAGYDIVDKRFTAGSIDLASARTRTTLLMNPIRKAVSALSTSASARFLGGYSLLVLARPREPLA